MATKKVTKVEKTEEELLAEIDLASNVGSDTEIVKEDDKVAKISKESLDEANKKLYETYGLITDAPEKRTEVKESKEHFLNGIVPAGFHKTYGDEITDITEGQVAEIVEAFNTVFSKDDNFRLFFNYIGNNILTVLLPLKWSQNDPSADALYLQIMKCDARSKVLRPGNYKQQVEQFAKRLAKRLNYQKGR